MFYLTCVLNNCLFMLIQSRALLDYILAKSFVTPKHFAHKLFMNSVYYWITMMQKREKEWRNLNGEILIVKIKHHISTLPLYTFCFRTCSIHIFTFFLPIYAVVLWFLPTLFPSSSTFYKYHVIESITLPSNWHSFESW